MPGLGKSGMSRIRRLRWPTGSGMRGSVTRATGSTKSEARSTNDQHECGTQRLRCVRASDLRFDSCFVLRRSCFSRPTIIASRSLPQRLVLDLADALAGQADALADFLERHRVFAVEAVAELEDLGRALVDLVEQLAELAELVAVADRSRRAPGLCVSATSSLIVISPSSAAAELRRRVVRLHRLADDLAASSATSSGARRARRRSAAGRACLPARAWPASACVIISTM